MKLALPLICAALVLLGCAVGFTMDDRNYEDLHAPPPVLQRIEFNEDRTGMRVYYQRPAYPHRVQWKIHPDQADSMHPARDFRHIYGVVDGRIQFLREEEPQPRTITQTNTITIYEYETR